MTTLNDLIVTDDVTDNLATYNNRFLGSMFSADNTNTETITATKELADSDCIYQVITASGASRTVELPPEATTNHPHLIYNTSASNTVPVKDDSGATTFITLAADEWALFYPVSGEAWQLVTSDSLSGWAAKTVPSGTVVGTTDTQTLTNKRITPRVTSETSSATPTINTDNSDCHRITALAAAITSFTTNLSGTPTALQELTIEILDDGTARAITWGASFASTSSGTLPTTTTLSKLLLVKLIWSVARSKWMCVAVTNEV